MAEMMLSVSVVEEAQEMLNWIEQMRRLSGIRLANLHETYPSGEGRLSYVGLMWRDCTVVQTPVFAPVQETVRWQVSRYWPVLSDVAGGALSRSRRLWRRHSAPVR